MDGTFEKKYVFERLTNYTRSQRIDNNFKYKGYRRVLK